MRDSKITGYLLIHECLSNAALSCRKHDQHMADVYLAIARRRLLELAQDLRADIDTHHRWASDRANSQTCTGLSFRLRRGHLLSLSILLQASVELSGVDSLRRTIMLREPTQQSRPPALPVGAKSR
ncbi:hypothetical protein ACQ4M4_27165 [Leptolyngbya sp. AN02str]|uniref:hypothetical protein n=1 Tax=Leptolyngbya sp. AN02str TaxID=3423363 RepID=UPI003D3186BA